MKYMKYMKYILIAVTSMSIYIENCLAGPWDYEQAYSTIQDLERESFVDRSDWMNVLPDEVNLHSISLPGTHDSWARFGGDIVRTQSLTVADQLRWGIRYLDMRCKYVSGVLELYHGSINLNYTCEDGLKMVDAFLQHHPSEVILVRIKQEDSEEPNERFFDAFQEIIKNVNLKKRIYVPTQQDGNNPTLSKLRGKILILQQFAESEPIGIPYNSIDVLDDVHFTTNWDLYSHWERIKFRLKQIYNDDHLYLTTIVGSAGSFPYFVASGRSSPNGPHLVTGLTTPGWSSSYPDFPRDACLGELCTIYFSGLNELVARELDFNHSGHIGIVVADFPGDYLIRSVISKNFQSWRSGGAAHKGDIYVSPNTNTQRLNYFYATHEGTYSSLPRENENNDDWFFLGTEAPAKWNSGVEYYKENELYSRTAAVGDTYLVQRADSAYAFYISKFEGRPTSFPLPVNYDESNENWIYIGTTMPRRKIHIWRNGDKAVYGGFYVAMNRFHAHSNPDIVVYLGPKDFWFTPETNPDNQMQACNSSHCNVFPLISQNPYPPHVDNGNCNEISYTVEMKKMCVLRWMDPLGYFYHPDIRGKSEFIFEY